MLFIDPDHQRQGVGTALIKHGLVAIEETRSTSPGLIVGLTSSPQGQVLYRRYGFEDVYWFRPKLQDLNEEGELVARGVSWPLMIKRYDA
jgi:GNAT superfamily N-acetyltransferase